MILLRFCQTFHPCVVCSVSLPERREQACKAEGPHTTSREKWEGFACSRPITEEAASVYLTDGADNDKLKAMSEKV